MLVREPVQSDIDVDSYLNVDLMDSNRYSSQSQSRNRCASAEVQTHVRVRVKGSGPVGLDLMVFRDMKNRAIYVLTEISPDFM